MIGQIPAHCKSATSFGPVCDQDSVMEFDFNHFSAGLVDGTSQVAVACRHGVWTAARLEVFARAGHRRRGRGAIPCDLQHHAVVVRHRMSATADRRSTKCRLNHYLGSGISECQRNLYHGRQWFSTLIARPFTRRRHIPNDNILQTFSSDR